MIPWVFCEVITPKYRDSDFDNKREMLNNLFHLLSTFVILQTSLASWFPSPHFVNTPTNVTVKEGVHAFLPCKVANLGDRSVTWMRKKNLHIISAGVLTYSPDNRYKVLHPANTNEWTLQIRYVQKSDHGYYECQVNSDPKLTKHFLLVVKDKDLDDPFYKHKVELSDNSTHLKIPGPNERYIQAGSILQVTCVVRHEENKGPKLVYWFHGAVKMDYSAPRGGISLETEKTGLKTVSKLRLSSVTTKDSGRYTCRPDTGGTKSVSVHVQSGHHEAAVQQSGDNFSKSIETCHYFILIFSFFHIFLIRFYS